MIIFYFVSIYVTMICLINAQNNEFSKRMLDSGSASQSCTSGLKNSYGTFLNDSGIEREYSTVGSDSYVFSSESVYCSSYSSSNYLNIGSHESNFFSLYQLPGTSISDHPTCYWRIENLYAKPLNVNIQRSKSSYEDINIEYSSNSNINFLSTRDIMNCVSDSVSLQLYNTSSIFIKVKRLNSKSDYKITVIIYPEDQLVFLWIILYGIGGILFIFLILTIIISIIGICKKRRSNNLNQSFEQTIKYITDTLKNMRIGFFKQGNPLYEQDKGIIGLEDFESEHEVNITNEGKHIFHGKCLIEWYINIGGNKLIGPHCCTENTPYSKLNYNDELSSLESVHIAPLPYNSYSESGLSYSYIETSFMI